MSDDPQDQPESDGYELVMPFVVTQSHGGPYEDQAFVAGYQAGQIDRALAVAVAAGATAAKFTVYTALKPQMELLAMRYGFLVEITPWAEVPESWSFVAFEAGGNAP